MEFLNKLVNPLILIIRLSIHVVCICFFSQTASQVKARHKLLEGAIGTFQEEQQAYTKISKLSWILPLIAIIGSLADTILVIVYMRFAHPWKDILFGQKKETEKAQSIEPTDIPDTPSKNQVRFFPFIYKQVRMIVANSNQKGFSYQN